MCWTAKAFQMPLMTQRVHAALWGRASESEIECLSHCSALKGQRLAQAKLRLNRGQKEQLALQGKENAAVLAMHQGHWVDIASTLQVCKGLRDAPSVLIWADYPQDMPDSRTCTVMMSVDCCSTVSAHASGALCLLGGNHPAMLQPLIHFSCRHSLTSTLLVPQC